MSEAPAFPGPVKLAAEAAHEAVRVLQRANGEEVSPPWADAPEWMRESVTSGIVAAMRGTTPEQSHEAWRLKRLGDGWILGPVKDTLAKVSPNLVPYDQLPAMQRLKDHVIVAIAEAFAREEL